LGGKGKGKTNSAGYLDTGHAGGATEKRRLKGVTCGGLKKKKQKNLTTDKDVRKRQEKNRCRKQIPDGTSCTPKRFSKRSAKVPRTKTRRGMKRRGGKIARMGTEKDTNSNKTKDGEGKVRKKKRKKAQDKGGRDLQEKQPREERAQPRAGRIGRVREQRAHVKASYDALFR